jgi:hypothetical protein
MAADHQHHVFQFVELYLFEIQNCHWPTKIDNIYIYIYIQHTSVI